MRPVVIITGPTCAGKSVLESKLTKVSGFQKFTSHTTREPRWGEVNGDHYHFVSEANFQTFREAGAFIEAVNVHGNWYGTHEAQMYSILHSGKAPVIVMDPNGRDTLLAWCEENDVPALPVFLTNPGNVRARRYLERVLKAFAARKDREDSQDFIGKHASRLDGMLTEEPEWGMANHPNAVAFGRFDEGNAGLVVGRIAELVSRLEE